MTTNLILELSRATVNDILMLLYRAWTNAYDARKIVHAMRNDGSSDWALFQVERIKNANAEENATKKVLDEFQNQLPKGFPMEGTF